MSSEKGVLWTPFFVFCNRAGAQILLLDRYACDRLNAAYMKRFSFFSMIITMLFLNSCNGMPKLFWDTEEGEGQPVYAQGGSRSAVATSRPPLDIPPELRTELELPQAEQIGGGADASALPEKYRASVAGKAVRLDARFYPGKTPADLFSAAVDALTSLNVPVDSVDSPSGIITSDWIKHGKKSSFILFGFTDSTLTRYRYMVRVYRAQAKSGVEGAQLEIRTIGQVFQTGEGWVTKPIKNKPVNELFDAVGEQLARMQTRPDTASESE